MGQQGKVPIPPATVPMLAAPDSLPSPEAPQVDQGPRGTPGQVSATNLPCDRHRSYSLEWGWGHNPFSASGIMLRTKCVMGGAGKERLVSPGSRKRGR